MTADERSRLLYSPEAVRGVARAKAPLWLVAALILLPVPTSLLGLVSYFPIWSPGDGVTFNYLLINFLAMIFTCMGIIAVFCSFARTHMALGRQVFICVFAGILHSLCAASGSLFGAFPLPFAPIVGASIPFSTTVLLSYLLVPAEARRTKQKEMKRCVVYLMFIFSVSTLWMVFRAVFISLTGLAQAASILILPAVRIGALVVAEYIISGDVDSTGMLAVPMTFAIEMYNAMFNASLFTDVSNPANAALIVLADMAGTFFYFGLMLDADLLLKRAAKKLWSRLRCRRSSAVYSADIEAREMKTRRERQRLSVASVTALDEDFHDWRSLVLAAAGGDDDTLSSRAGKRLRWKLRVSAFLLVEEFIEVQVPLIMMCCVTYQRLGWNPGMYPTVASMPIENYYLTLQYLALSFLAEAVLFACTGFILWKKFRINLAEHLIFLLGRYWWLLFTLSCLVISFVMSINSSFTGIDFTFKFAWIKR
eukprot:PLAT3360.4.p1 GENE.PLAT3360.4~~PLAT3360.4.p1  ORF type:complete len:480 (-),score=129.43 PLAT3360.4:61-1500(-)